MNIKKRKILINDLVLLASIGVYEQEKKQKQKIKINLEVLLTNESEPNKDDLNSTQDYCKFRKLVLEIVERKHYELIETIANQIYSDIIDQKCTLGVKVKIIKPDIFNDCEVGYELSNI